jgi:sec-independent protein translocase protein TatA
MGALQPMHLMLIALAVLLVFGPRKLPELARGVGESMKELKRGLHGVAASEEAALAQEIGRTVQEIQTVAHPLTPPASSAGRADAPPA